MIVPRFLSCIRIPRNSSAKIIVVINVFVGDDLPAVRKGLGPCLVSCMWIFALIISCLVHCRSSISDSKPRSVACDIAARSPLSNRRSYVPLTFTAMMHALRISEAALPSISCFICTCNPMCFVMPAIILWSANARLLGSRRALQMR